MKKMKYEDAVSRLEEIVEALESGDKSLDESMKLFEEGTKLCSYCNELLKNAKQNAVRKSSSERRFLFIF